MVRVECLYRVSTKGQVDHDDIPMQRIECRKFAEQNGWTIIKELQEKGVSGFKVSANDRDAIQELREDAAENRFDVLLVFMFDRLGRRDDETPFVVEWFAKQGIRIFSVKEGEQKFESHTDSLIINYPNMLISVRVFTRPISGFFKQTKCIIPFTINVKLDFSAILLIDNILHCLKILWLCVCPFRNNQMILWLDSDFPIKTFFHPSFIQVAFLWRL